MRTVILAGLAVLGLPVIAMAQDNAAGTSNGTFEHPKPEATMMAPPFSHHTTTHRAVRRKASVARTRSLGAGTTAPSTLAAQ